MSEFDQDEAVEKQAPKKIKVLTLSVVLGDDADLAGILAAVENVGEEIRSLSINNQFDYPNDFGLSY